MDNLIISVNIGLIKLISKKTCKYRQSHHCYTATGSLLTGSSPSSKPITLPFPSFTASPSSFASFSFVSCPSFFPVQLSNLQQDSPTSGLQTTAAKSSTKAKRRNIFSPTMSFPAHGFLLSLFLELFASLMVGSHTANFKDMWLLWVLLEQSTIIQEYTR